MTAALALNNTTPKDNQENQEPRRNLSRYLLVLANDPDFERAIIALAESRGRGKIELTYDSGRLVNVDLKVRFK